LRRIYVKGKGKASSLDIAPLTGQRRFTTSEVAADWQWKWRGARSGSRVRANGLLGPQLQPLALPCVFLASNLRCSVAVSVVYFLHWILAWREFTGLQ